MSKVLRLTGKESYMQTSWSEPLLRGQDYTCQSDEEFNYLADKFFYDMRGAQVYYFTEISKIKPKGRPAAIEVEEEAPATTVFAPKQATGDMKVEDFTVAETAQEEVAPAPAKPATRARNRKS